MNSNYSSPVVSQILILESIKADIFKLILAIHVATLILSPLDNITVTKKGNLLQRQLPVFHTILPW